MEIKTNKKDVIWSFIVQFFNVGSGIIILPLILKKLSSDELGIWYIFLMISNLIYLLDFGFLPSIQRNVAYVYSGASELLKEGINFNKIDEINFQLLSDIINISRDIYKKISFLTIFLLLTFGTYYIKSLGNLNKSIIIAWILYSFSICLNFYYFYFNALLRGKGLIEESNKILLFSRLGFIIFSILGIYMKLGLLAMSLGNIISVIIIRVCSYKIFFTKTLQEKIKKYKVIKNKNLFNVIFFNSYKQGLVSVSTFFTVKGNLFLATKFFTLAEVAQYGLTIQIFGLLTTICTTLINVFLSKLSNYRINKDVQKIKELYSFCFINNLIIFILGTLTIIYLSPYFFKLLDSKITLLSRKILIFFSMITLLEMIQINAGMFISTSNKIPFLKSSILTAIGIVSLSFFLLKYTSFGMWGMLFSQFFIQLLYNDWKWVSEVNKELKINFLDILKLGISSNIKILKGEKINGNRLF